MLDFLKRDNKFKRRNIRKTKEGVLIPFITSIAVLSIFFIWIFVLNWVNNAHFDENFLKNQISELEKKELTPSEKRRLKELIEKREKLKLKFEQDQNKVNILILGRWGYWNDAPELTDSIILASLHKKQNHISMFSIPRDLYVEYGDFSKDWKKIKWKINWLYVHYLAKFQDEEKAIEKLKEKITEITDEKIDHYVNLDFRWFKKLINSIWWVKITVPKTLIDEKYPDNNHWHQTFILRKWTWLLDWEVALKYVRTRKNTGWDFWRSQRQQQVVSAIKTKILSLWYLTSPNKIKKLYNIFSQYIITDIWAIDAVKIFTQIKLQDNTKIYSSWLNTSCIKDLECSKWWFLFYPNRSYFGWQSVLLSDWTTYKNLSNYNIIHEFTDNIFNYPKLFEEMNKISIFSKIDDREKALELKYNLVKHWLNVNVAEIIWNIKKWNNALNLKKKQEEGKKLNLSEYNELKNSNINSNSWSVNKNSISQEYFNNNTIIIINSIDKNNNTINFLKKYLNISDKNIIENIWWPKYAKDKKTKIEIIFIDK